MDSTTHTSSAMDTDPAPAPATHPAIINPTSPPLPIGSPGTPTMLTSASRKNRERSRVSRACDRCKEKKVRCSGTNPCDVCVKGSHSCDFTAHYTRGKPPNIESFRAKKHSAAVAIVPSKSTSSAATNGFLPINQAPSHARGKAPELFSQPQILRHERQAPEPVGVALHNNVIQKMNTPVLDPNASVLSYGDAPFPDYDPSFFVLPPMDVTKQMVDAYFTLCAPTNRILHRPTIDEWVKDFYDRTSVMRDAQEAKSRRAIILMIFAEAQPYIEATGRDGFDDSARYFQAADHQLQTETGPLRVESIQARLMQCYFLLSRARVNQCTTLFGIIYNMIFCLKIHRRGQSGGSFDLITIESSRRTFWSAYTLDKYLCSVLTRPCVLKDEDIDQELPTQANDEEIFATCVLPRRQGSIMVGGLLQIQLTKQLEILLRELYGVKVLPLRDRIRKTKERRTALEEWRNEVKVRFEPILTKSDTAIEIQKVGLDLVYYHHIILVYRPFLLTIAPQSYVEQEDATRLSDEERQLVKDYIKECLDASLHVLKYSISLFETLVPFAAAWFGHFVDFTAISAIYIWMIQLPENQSPTIDWKTYFNAAETCHDLLRTKPPLDSLGRKCSEALDELKNEAVHRVRDAKPSSDASKEASAAGNSITNAPNTTNMIAEAAQLKDHDMFNGFADRSQLGISQNRTSWNRFDQWGFDSMTGY